MSIDLFRELPAAVAEELALSPKAETTLDETDEHDNLASILRELRMARHARVRIQADTGRWDKFWERHGDRAGLFDRLLWPTRVIFSARHARLLLRHLRKQSPLHRETVRVLEIGCGSATTSSFISQEAANATLFGVDLSEAAIKVARTRNPNLHCVVADAMALPFVRERFSLVFSSGVIEHFDRSIADRMHAEHCRVSRDGGTVGLIVPWKHSPYNLLRILCGGRWPFGHENPFSVGELRRFARNQSISDVEVHVSYGTTLTGIGRKQEILTTCGLMETQLDEGACESLRPEWRASLHSRTRETAPMLGDSRTFKAALTVNLATRGSRLGPMLARVAYWLWNSWWDAYFAVRAALCGSVAAFEVQGKQMLMDTRDRTVTRVLYVFGAYEPIETMLLAHLLEPGFTFIDIGANTGYYTLLAAQTVGEHGKVIAFEPDPVNAEILRTNVRHNDLSNVVVEQTALSGEEGELRLYLSSINAGDHRIYDGRDDDFYNLGRDRSHIPVHAVTLDKYLGGKGGAVDFIKMDVQGAEYDVLRGMAGTLASNESIMLMAEYWPHGLERCAGEPSEFLSVLHQMGFRVFRARPEGQAEEVEMREVSSFVTGLESLTLFFSRSYLQSPPTVGLTR